jgi:hypothetical protein
MEKSGPDKSGNESNDVIVEESDSDYGQPGGLYDGQS